MTPDERIENYNKEIQPFISEWEQREKCAWKQFDEKVLSLLEDIGKEFYSMKLDWYKNPSVRKIIKKYFPLSLDNTTIDCPVCGRGPKT